MFNTIITTVKTLLRRPSTWVWGAIFPIALSTMFMFMFANLSSDGKIDPVPVAVVADEAWTLRPLRAWWLRLPRRATISCSM